MLAIKPVRASYSSLQFAVFCGTIHANQLSARNGHDSIHSSPEPCCRPIIPAGPPRLAPPWQPAGGLRKSAALRGTNPGWRLLPATGDEERPLPHAWRAQHRATHRRGLGLCAPRPLEARLRQRGDAGAPARGGADGAQSGRPCPAGSGRAAPPAARRGRRALADAAAIQRAGASSSLGMGSIARIRDSAGVSSGAIVGQRAVPPPSRYASHLPLGAIAPRGRVGRGHGAHVCDLYRCEFECMLSFARSDTVIRDACRC